MAGKRYPVAKSHDGNVLYKNNLVKSLASELYHPNGSANGDGYDALNRIVSFTRGTLTASGSTLDTVTTANQDTNLPQHTETWNLDALGNWTGNSAIAIDGTNQSRTVDSRNRYTAVGGATVTPDNIGNIVQDETGLKYAYDIWNRVVKVENSSGSVLETYTYDAFGRRITETPSAQTTKDLYFDGSKVIEEQQSGTTTNQYVWGLGYVNSLVLRDDNSSSGSYGKSNSGLGRRLFVEQDADWNVTSLTSVGPNASVQERFVQDPYGRVQVVDPTNWNTSTDSFNWIYHFQGGRQDPISGLVHFGTPGRDYSTTLGRWTEPDNSYIDGANVYQADGSSPVANVDPSGMYIRRGGKPILPTHPGEAVPLALPGVPVGRGQRGPKAPPAGPSEYDQLRNAGYSPGSAALVMTLERTPGLSIACSLSNLKYGENFTHQPLSNYGKTQQVIDSAYSLFTLMTWMETVGSIVAAASSGAPEAAASTRFFGNSMSADIAVQNGAATIDIGSAASLDSADIDAIMQIAMSNGATSAVVNTGKVVNTDLALNLGQRAAQGRTFCSGTVKDLSAGGVNKFQILFGQN